MIWLILCLVVCAYCVGGCITECHLIDRGHDRREASRLAARWPIYALVGLAKMLGVALLLAVSPFVFVYLHVTAREERRLVYLARHEQQCRADADEWRELAREYKRADYGISTAVLYNAADLMDSLADAFADDQAQASPSELPNVLPAPRRAA